MILTRFHYLQTEEEVAQPEDKGSKQRHKPGPCSVKQDTDRQCRDVRHDSCEREHEIELQVLGADRQQ